MRLLRLQILGLASALFCVAASASNLTRLTDGEVNALQKIASRLRMDWDFNTDPCSGEGQWIVSMNSPFAKNLTCDCNATSNICHVTSIQLKGLNLIGILPDEFANLTHLSILDLTWNCLDGSIPISWASLPLTYLNLQGNRISGRIPEELGNITTLTSLILEDNQLQGPLPQSLAKLVNLDHLILSGNNITGELPVALGNLTNLTDFRIDGNPISGRIPSFITNRTKLQRLDLQGTSLEGPFPLNFSNLQTLTQLSISDMKGGVMFPPLENMNNLETLILRNLSLSGQIPHYIGDMTNLRILDLSFNNLTGEIPGSFLKLQRIHNMYLTNNFLNGLIPMWIFTSNQNLDISDNNFTGPPPPSTCQEGNVNLAASYTPTYSKPVPSCFRRNLPCTGDANNYYLFINCGGSRVTSDSDEYEEDSSSQGPSTYGSSASGKWAYISTGNFIDSLSPSYIVENTSVLKVSNPELSNPELYMTARVSAVSLKYIGLCLQNGNYTVKLHFAEIMFTDDQTYASNGRRLFDVSIQGQKVLHDFNIAKEANGTGRVIVKSFFVIVTENTVEIELLWAGKGTRTIPEVGVYGPLISAISVTPNFNPHTKLSVGVIAGISIACVVATLFVLAVLWIWWRRKWHENKDFGGLKLHGSYFSFEQIEEATNNFNPTNKIGEGGFGSVYKGVLPDGSVIAVKQLSSKSKQGNREFLTEIGMISGLQHPNLVKLYGCCVERSQLLLVYEYMENNCLARALFGPERSRLKLDWDTRCNICLGIARGLAYLHEESKLKIVHRDIKATNILLDKNLNAKISDFGLAKLDDEENTHISTRIAGTIGYMAPEYAMRGYLTDKADVYSFGVVVLELVSGKSNSELVPKQEFMYMLDWVCELQKEGRLGELVDPNLGSNYSETEVMRLLNIALACTNRSQNLRPSMSSVVSILEGRTPVEVLSVKPAVAEGETSRFKAFRTHSGDGDTSLSSSVSAYSNIIEEKETSFFEEQQVVSSEVLLH